MKVTKFLQIITLLVILASCEQIDFETPLNNNQAKNASTLISQQFKLNYYDIETFVELRLNCDKRAIGSISPIVFNNDTVLFVVNYKNNKGWEVISADKRTTPILAYSQTGEFDTKSYVGGVNEWTANMAENIYALKMTAEADTATTDFELWNKIQLKNKKAQSQATTRVGVKPNDLSDGIWEIVSVNSKSLESVYSGPYTQTTWGQEFPWNQCVPYNSDYSGRCVAGCIAIAGAQMLYYLHTKFNILPTFYSTGSCNGYAAGSKNYNYRFDFGNATSSAWNEMAKNSYDGKSTYQSSILIGWVGQNVGMTYNAKESGASNSSLINLFSNLGITCQERDLDYNNIVSNLNKGIPVITSAYATKDKDKILGITIKTTYKDGHSWIIDGYEDVQIQYTYLYRWRPNTGDNTRPERMGPLLKEETRISTTKYFIMNWGWAEGYNNGRYVLNGDWKNGGYNFQYKRSMITDFAKK